MLNTLDLPIFLHIRLTSICVCTEVRLFFWCWGRRRRFCRGALGVPLIRCSLVYLGVLYFSTTFKNVILNSESLKNYHFVFFRFVKVFVEVKVLNAGQAYPPNFDPSKNWAKPLAFLLGLLVIQILLSGGVCLMDSYEVD